MRAQEKDYAQQLEELFAEMDSLSIYHLLDSALSVGSVRYSELNIRSAYTSNVAVAGRNYGINQHGFAPGISYYHKSGIFGDVTGYMNSAFEPNYSLTMVSLGYFGTKKNFSFIPSYERWIYNNDPTATLFNSLGVSLNQGIKFINVGADYSFLFGEETAHRLIFSLNGYVSFKDFWFFDAISIMPTASILFGNDDITTVRLSEDQAFRGNFLYSISQLSAEQQRLWLRYSIRRGLINEERALQFQQNLESYGTILTPEAIATIENKLFSESTNDVFGLMNLSFSLPVFFTIDRFSISINYSYNIPYSLPGEVFEFDPIGYLGTSITYRIPFKE